MAKMIRTLAFLILFLTIFTTLITQSNANQTQPIPEIMKTDQLPAKIEGWSTNPLQFQETKLKMTPSMVLAGVFCFVAASISSAGGIGGGGLYIPILTIVADLDLKAASSFSAFMVTGGSIANVVSHMFTKSNKFGGKSLINYDIALLSEPSMLLGVSVGVICNLVFPEWLITLLFAVFLAWSTVKTWKNGVVHWRLESEEVVRTECGILGNGVVIDGFSDNGDVTSTEAPLLGVGGNKRYGLPWMKLGILVVVWFSFFSLYLLRGNRYGEGIITIKPCGLAYWILSSLQIPLAISFTSWILLRKEADRTCTNQQGGGVGPNKFIFPIMALLAGILGGLFGIGGGMLISPLLLHVGIAPEVTAATCSFMVFFSSTMSAFQYLLLGMEHTGTALIFAIICLAASFIGLLLVQRAIKGYGRASLIVFSVSMVMTLSTILITSFGAIDVWRDYKSGKYMGFKPPC